ncbi:MAG: THUMP domain-containing protein [Thermoprotei archaeon]
MTVSNSDEIRPVALVRVKPGAESRATKELSDLFERFRIKAEIRDSGVEGNLLVFSSAPKGYVAAVLGKSKLAYAETIILIDATSQPDLNSMIDTASKVLMVYASKKKIKSFRVKARVRGSSMEERKIEIEMGRVLKESVGLSVDLENPDVTVYVNVVGEFVAVTIA